MGAARPAALCCRPAGQRARACDPPPRPRAARNLKEHRDVALDYGALAPQLPAQSALSLLDEDALRQPGGPVEDSKYCQAVPAGSGSNFKCATVTPGGRVALFEMATKLIMCTGPSRGFARMPVHWQRRCSSPTRGRRGALKFKGPAQNLAHWQQGSWARKNPSPARRGQLG